MKLKLKKYSPLIIFNLLNLILFLFAVKNSNDVLVYSFFSIISIISINYFFIAWQYYTELFLNLFIYLGFWLKFSFNLIYSFNKRIPETNEFLSEVAIRDNYSEVLIVTGISILFISLVFLFLKKVFPRKNKRNFSFIFLIFTIKKFKIKFLTSFFLFFYFIIFLNILFDFAYLGQQSSGFFIIEKLFKGLLIIVFPLFITLICDLYFKIHGKSFVILLLLFLSFFSIAISLDSRSMIVYLLPILLVYIHYFKTFKYIALLTIISSVLIFISINLVQKSRSNSEFYNRLLSDTFKEIYYLSTNRWVGISGMINVHYTKNKNYKMFTDSLSEKSGLFNFYERNFYYSQDENSLNFKSEDEFLKNIKNYKRISVYIPGFMAFFYYSGSIFFLLFLNLILIIFLILIEKSCAFIMRHNNLFIAMFSMILIWRTIHIGLFPLNTLLFFIILTLVPFVFLILDKILLGFIKRKKS